MLQKLKAQSAKRKTATQILKVLTLTLSLYTLTFAFYPFPVYAQADNIGEARIDPSSPLYFLKSVREIWELKFAKTTMARATKQLELATQRIREVKSLVKTSKQDLIEPTLIKYLSHLQELRGITNLADENQAAQITETATLHMSVLQSVYPQVFSPIAKRSIRVAVYKLSQLDQELIDKFDSLNKYPLAYQLTASKLAACNFLAKVASSSALNETERVIFTSRAKSCSDSLKKSGF